MEKDILYIAEFGHAVWKLILSIYELGQDVLTANKDNKFFCQCILAQFKPTNPKKEKILYKDKKESVNSDKLANVSRIPHSVLQRPNKKFLKKLKFYKLKVSFFTSSSSLPSSKGYSYAQAFQNNIKDIVKIKDNFSNLSIKKIEEVHKILNNIKKKTQD